MLLVIPLSATAQPIITLGVSSVHVFFFNYQPLSLAEPLDGRSADGCNVPARGPRGTNTGRKEPPQSPGMDGPPLFIYRKQISCQAA